MYITENGIFGREELAGEERGAAGRVLVMYCSATMTPFADGVPRKGADQDGYEGGCINQNILWLGHSKVCIRSDNELALVQVAERAAAALKMSGLDVVAKGSMPYDPQTNGAAENAMRLVKGMLKVLLLGMER